MENEQFYLHNEDTQQLFNITQAFELSGDTFGSVIFVFDIAKQTFYVSKSDAEFLGISEVNAGVPYGCVSKGVVTSEYASEYIRVFESIMEGAERAKGFVGLRSAKGITNIYELSMRVLKDKNGKRNGKAVGLFRNVTEYANAIQKEIDLNFKTTNVYEEISKRLARASNLENGVNSVLRFVGEYLDVSRVYIFENKYDKDMYGSNTFEWCAPGIEPQIQNLQNLRYSDYGYDQVFKDTDVLVGSNVAELPPNLRKILEPQNIKAVLHYAIRDNGRFSGFIGLDDCERTREDWQLERGEVKMLAFVAEMLSMYLMKERNMQRQLKSQVREEKYHSALAHNAAYTMVADITTDTIVKDVIGIYGKHMLEQMGLKAPCSYNEANRRFIEINGIEVLTPAGDHFFTTEGLLEMFAQGVRYESVEYYIPSADEYFRVVPLMGIDPETGHIIAHIFGYNVTNEVQEEQRQHKLVEDALKEAEHANAAKTEFLNNMSHDIRTPMNAIVGFTTLAGENIDDKEKVLEYLTKIKSSGNHLLSLINDILDMSRIESGKMNFEEVEIFLPEFVNDLQNIMQDGADAKGLNFIVNSINIKHNYILADKLRLNQMFLNCLSNAMKFTPQGGTVIFSVEELSASSEGFAEFEFKIKDNGIGMKPEFLKHIFEPFERERNSTVSGIQGTGLGMSIVKNLVDMMDGVVSCESEFGKGSEFTINLKLKISEDKEHVPDKTRESNTHIDDTLDGINILVVEDNDLNREIAEVFLTEIGANVSTAVDGEVAVDIIKNAPMGTYDVVLMDIQMPVMNGIEATRAIRRLPDKDKASIPIIAMTANAFSEDRREALDAGMQDFITKPIQIDRIIFTIKEVLK